VARAIHLMRARVCQESVDASVWEEEAPSAEAVAGEAKREWLRAEIGLVDEMIEEAESQRADEVFRKLVDYRAKSKRELGS
jgi:hypothetical protein